MKRKEEFIVREIGGEHVLMPIGETALKFSGLVVGNEVAVFIWEHIEEVKNAEEMATLITEEFEVEYKTALEDADELLGEMIKAGWIE